MKSFLNLQDVEAKVQEKLEEWFLIAYELGKNEQMVMLSGTCKGNYRIRLSATDSLLYPVDTFYNHLGKAVDQYNKIARELFI